MSVNLPRNLSWSQVSSYSECGERYRIEKLHRMPRPNYFTTLAGRAIHTLTEAIDRAVFVGFTFAQAVEMAPSFQSEFDREIAEWQEENPDDELLASQKKGMKSITENGGPDGKDYAWWLHWGPLYVNRYVRWREAYPHMQPAVMEDGSPGIELEFVIEIDGIRVVGYIDRLMRDQNTGELILLDIKNGKKPETVLQLVTYALGMEVTYGIKPQRGLYWLPRSPTGFEGEEFENIGQMTDPVDIGDWDQAKMAAMFTGTMRGIANGVFIPHVTAMCKGCSVRQFCWAVGGLKSSKLPVYDEIYDSFTGELAFDGSTV